MNCIPLKTTPTEEESGIPAAFRRDQKAQQLERAHRLLADPNYPDRKVIRSIARRIADDILQAN